MAPEELNPEKINRIKHLLIDYFENRLRYDPPQRPIFPHYNHLVNCSELEKYREELGDMFVHYVDSAIGTLLEEKAITRYDDPLSDRKNARDCPMNFSYTGDLEIIAANHRRAVAIDDL